MEPTNLYADTIAPVQRTKEGELFRIQFEARPNPDSPETADTAGAYVNCWVDADDLRTAELRAIELIQEQGWLPVRIEDWELCCRECYSPERCDPDEAREILEHIEEAFTYGAASIFYCWSQDAPDANQTPE